MWEKRRALPAWMERKEEKKEKEPLKSRRKRKSARSAFYCMNEEELVEAAVCFLTSGEDAALRTDQQVEHKAADTRETKRRKPATPQTTAEPLEEKSSDLDMTYVSETDLDITEVETVPYTTSLQRPASEDQRSKPAQDVTTVDPEAERRTEQPREDDALRLVREIFFT